MNKLEQLIEQQQAEARETLASDIYGFALETHPDGSPYYTENAKEISDYVDPRIATNIKAGYKLALEEVMQQVDPLEWSKRKCEEKLQAINNQE